MSWGEATRSARRARHRDREAGSTTLEAVVIAPAALLLIALVIVAGRIALANQAVTAAAFDAARSASLARTATAAQADGTAAGQAILNSQGIVCVPGQITLAGWPTTHRAGESGTVTATVTCRVPLADLALPGLPGAVTLQASASSPLDWYRE